ncbi:MAG: M3 family oligoendopeptidase [Lachnospiraceae bacterium]|nr:M3 family oligoendopeptidase [Lachnospiraceae bacterium]
MDFGKFVDLTYERVDIEDYKKQMGKIISDFKEAKNGEEQFKVHERFYILSDHVMTEYQIAYIRHSIDVTDEFYEKENDYWDLVNPQISNIQLEYSRLMYDSPYRDYLEEKIGPVAFKNIEIAKKSMNEKIIPLMQEENSLATRYEKLLASAKIDWHGETLNISLLNPYRTGADRSVRKEAWEKTTGFLEDNADELDEIYDLLVKNRTAQARAMGYKDYVELGYYRMNRNSYTRSEIEQLRNMVKKEFVPFAEKMHEERRARIGVEKLSYYDEGVYFKEGNPKPVGTPEEILKNGQKMYGELSPETKEFMDFMMEHDLFDVLGKKTKQAGGYMTYIPDYKAPFIFANFNGSSSDVDVITHECGHAFQGYIAAKDPIREHSEITMDTAEIHSMSMEFFTEPHMELFFGKDADRYREMHLDDAIAFVPYGTMVDEFQHIVYENPDMTPSERRSTWARLEKEYRPHQDYSENTYLMNGGFWQKQHHIYSLPFYYIDYVLSQLCAFQYRIWMKKDYREAFDSYLKLCKMSAARFYPEMLHSVGLKVPYEEGTIRYVTENLISK